MKTGSYKHLNEHDRVRLEVYLREGKSQYEIAKALQVDKSTISREIKKRGAILTGYSAVFAQRDYEAGKRNCGARSKIETQSIGGYVIDHIKKGWSPESIAGRLRREIKQGKRGKEEYVCHESIYQFVFDSEYGKQENLRQYLRYGKQRRTKQKGRHAKHEIIPNRIWIDARPKEVNTRKTIGHWEGDTIMYGKLKGVNSLVERKTRYLILTKLKDKTPTETEQAVVSSLNDQFVKTITFDNGVENKNHQNMAYKLKANIYFCHPYHSWEKGTNENTNGLVRRYLPKKTDISLVPQEDIDDIAWELNNRPRKVLEFATPEEVLELEYSKLSIVALNSRI